MEVGSSPVTANTAINGSPYIILFLTWFSGAETQINPWKLPSIDRRSIVVVLWHHANAYCDVILADCHENISKWVTFIFPPSSSWSSLVNYRELFKKFSLAGMQEFNLLTMVLLEKNTVHVSFWHQWNTDLFIALCSICQRKSHQCFSMADKTWSKILNQNTFTKRITPKLPHDVFNIAWP